MKNITAIFILFLGFYPLLFFGQTDANSKPCVPCEQLKQLRLPDVTILKAESLTIGYHPKPRAVDTSLCDQHTVLQSFGNDK